MVIRSAARIVWPLAVAAFMAGCGGGGGGGGPPGGSGAGRSAIPISGQGGGGAFTVGGTVTGLTGSGLVLENNGTDDLAISAAGAFTFATAVANGAAYNVTVKIHPVAQFCTVTGGSGVISGANVTSVSVNCVTPAPRFAYAANNLDNSVSSYVVDAATGRLKFIGKAATGNGPRAVTVDPTGRYAYVANALDNTLSQYRIAANGGLTPLTSPTVASGTSPFSVTVDPSGKFVFVANSGSNDVSAYSINSATGALTAISCGAVNTSGCSGSAVPTNFAAGVSPRAVTVDPSATHLYVANFSGNSISQYAIASNGSLALLATMPAAGSTATPNPDFIAVEATGRFAYVTNATEATVAQYTIGANGSLTPMTPPTVAAGAAPASAATDLHGKLLVVANAGSNDISAYSINATTGALTPISCGAVGATGCSGATLPTNFAAGAQPQSVGVDPSGKYLFVTNALNGAGGNSVAQYSIGATGALTSLAPATVAAQAAPISVAMTRGALPVVAVPKYAYVANSGSNDVSAYGISASTGGLTQISCGAVGTAGCSGSPVPTNFLAGTAPSSVAIEPAGKYAYVANSASGDITAYAINAASGVLSTISCGPPGTPGCTGAASPTNFAAGSVPAAFVPDPSGRYAYVANTGSNGVSQYAIAASGALTPLVPATVAAGLAPTAAAVDPSGSFVYVANNGSADVSAFSIGLTGTLTQISCGSVGTAGCTGAAIPTNFTAGTQPQAIAVAPSGKFAYVANQLGNSVSQYAIAAAGGLTPLTPSTVTTGTQPVSIAIDPAGKFAYVANLASNDVSAYSLGANGALTQINCSALGIAGCSAALPANFAAGPSPRSVSVDVSGHYLYVANSSSTTGGRSVAQYTINANGSLTLMTPVSVPAGLAPGSVANIGTWQ